MAKFFCWLTSIVSSQATNILTLCSKIVLSYKLMITWNDSNLVNEQLARGAHNSPLATNVITGVDKACIYSCVTISCVVYDFMCAGWFIVWSMVS